MLDSHIPRLGTSYSVSKWIGISAVWETNGTQETNTGDKTGVYLCYNNLT